MELEQYLSCALERTEGQRPFDTDRLPAASGVFALTDEQGRVLQLSCGQHIRRLVAARLYPEVMAGERPRIDLLAVTRRVLWEPTRSHFETQLKFHEISYRFYPREHLKMCRFGPAWFAVLDLQERFPQWLASREPLRGNSACVGPFDRRSSCEALVHHLEELFSLCRYHHILEQTPNGQACAYFEMGRCPAPCDGTVPWTHYLELLRRSHAWVLEQDDRLEQQLTAEMQAASQSLAFETAARCRESLEQAEGARRLLAGRSRRLEEFRYLIVQPLPRGRRVQAFLVHQGTVSTLDPIAASDLEAAVPGWIAGLQALTAPEPDDPTFATERIWLVCHLLHHPKRGPGFCQAAATLGPPSELLERLRQDLALQKTGPRRAG